MAITLNGLVLDDLLTSVCEQHEEVGGRDARTVEISGLVLGESSLDAIETRLDAVLDAASAGDSSAALSVRSARRLTVRRAHDLAVFFSQPPARRLTPAPRISRRW